LQIAIHAIGDQANDDVLNMYQYARNNNSNMNSPRRHRVEHVQHVSGLDSVAALSQQQTAAVVNPLHLLSDMHIMMDRLGQQRSGADHAFAYKAMLQVRLKLSLHQPLQRAVVHSLCIAHWALHGINAGRNARLVKPFNAFSDSMNQLLGRAHCSTQELTTNDAII